MFTCPRCLLSVEVTEEMLPFSCCGLQYPTMQDIANIKLGPVVVIRCEKCGARRRTSENSGSVCSKCNPLIPLVDVGLNINCQYRGEQTRFISCESCGGKTRIKVFQCAAYGECTFESTDPKIHACRGCMSYSPPSTVHKPVRFVTNADLIKDSLKLIPKLPHQVSAIAGIPRSGMMPASLIATSLHLPLYTLTHKGFDLVGCGWRLSDVVHNHREGPVVVIDDTSMYGGALSMAKEFWKKFGGGREAVFSTVYCSPVKYHQHGPMPDVWAQELDDPHLLEWCFFNCGFAKRTAFDFDGVLTVDGTDKPLYKPMKYPVELIVTGRLEKQREYSENWLRRHGIRWKKMVMWRGSLEERDESVEKIAEFKAEEFDKSGLRFFVESDPVQSAHIAKLTKKLVICPTIAKVF